MASALPARAAQTALVALAAGEVTVKRDGKKYRVPTDKPNRPVLKGDWIETGKDSLAIITFPDGSRTKLNAESAFAIEEVAEAGGDAPSAVRLDYGSVFAQVEGAGAEPDEEAKKKPRKDKFRISTKTATMGVRGTRFYTGFGGKDGWEKRKEEGKPANVWMCVAEGQVEVTPADGGDAVPVKEGEGIVVKEGKISPPKPYEWTKELNWKMEGDPADLVNKASWKDTEGK
jgi:hypothetical protein